MSTAQEAVERFACFGSECEVRVMGTADPAAAARDARALLLAWHERFTRFDSGSELSRLNADPRPAVEVSEEMAAFVAAARGAAEATGGLVDPTLLRRLETLGYRDDLRQPVPLLLALRLAPPRRPASPSAEARWAEIEVDGTRVRRPPGPRHRQRRDRQGARGRRAGAAAGGRRGVRRRLRR